MPCSRAFVEQDWDWKRTIPVADYWGFTPTRTVKCFVHTQDANSERIRKWWSCSVSSFWCEFAGKFRLQIEWIPEQTHICRGVVTQQRNSLFVSMGQNNRTDQLIIHSKSISTWTCTHHKTCISKDTEVQDFVWIAFMCVISKFFFTLMCLFFFFFGRGELFKGAVPTPRPHL